MAFRRWAPFHSRPAPACRVAPVIGDVWPQMFSRRDFETLPDEQLDSWQFGRSYKGLHHTVYPQYAFSPPDSEQFIKITRAPKEDRDDGLRFWINAELIDDWGGRRDKLRPYLSASLFRPITEEEFNDRVEAQARDLADSVQLPIRKSGRCVGGLAMHTMETDSLVSLVAEYEDEYIHFYWETSA